MSGLAAAWRPAGLAWLLALSLVGFGLMGLDKRRARQGGRRVPERAFFLLAMAGGTPGLLAGMHLFRHKTRHWYFRYGLPLLLAGQVGLAAWLLWAYGQGTGP